MTNTNFSGRVVGDVAVLRSLATALPKCSKQGGWWGLMAVGQSGALRSDPFRTFDLGWRLGTMVVLERSDSGAAPF